MKLLVYGSGVVGSYLAHILSKGGNEVHILARGSRYEYLKREGLIIKHHIQGKTTVDKLHIIKELRPEDYYDIIFVTMQYTQIQSVLPVIARSRASTVFVLVGNNPSAAEMQCYIDNNSSVKKQLIFAFQSVGGRNEKERIISIHSKHLSSLILGTLNGENNYKNIIEKVFQQTDLKLQYHDDINAMLVSHLAFILPLAYACYFYHGNLKKAFQTKQMRNTVVNAIEEGFRAVETSGITPNPYSQVLLVREKKRTAGLLLKLIACTPMGRLAISDHAMAAAEEMESLSECFDILRKKASVQMQNWDKLRNNVSFH